MTGGVSVAFPASLFQQPMERKLLMSGEYGKVLSFGAFELSIGNMFLANGEKAAPPEICDGKWWNLAPRSSFEKRAYEPQ